MQHQTPGFNHEGAENLLEQMKWMKVKWSQNLLYGATFGFQSALPGSSYLSLSSCTTRQS